MNKLPTVAQMSKTMSENPNRRLNYKEQADQHKGEALAADIQNKIAELRQAAMRGRVDFRNMEQVQARIYEYLTACGQAEAFPSVQGLAVYAFGYSRQGLNRYLREHPDEPAAQFIEMTKDIIVDILTNQSLYRNCDSVQAIFQMKNNHNFADKLEIEPVQKQSGLGEEVDQRILEEHLLNSIAIED